MTRREHACRGAREKEDWKEPYRENGIIEGEVFWKP
jgi:hypothetical protein